MGIGSMTYQELYAMVSKALYRTHVEGKLKSEIIQASPEITPGPPSVDISLMDPHPDGSTPRPPSSH